MYSENISIDSIARGRIEQIRKSALNSENKTGLTQKEMAAKLNLTQSAYSKLISGKRAISTDVLVSAAKLGRVSTDWILGLTEDSKCVYSSLDSLGLTEKSGNALKALYNLSGGPQSDCYHFINDILSHPKLEFILLDLLSLSNAYRHFFNFYSNEEYANWYIDKVSSALGDLNGNVLIPTILINPKTDISALRYELSSTIMDIFDDVVKRAEWEDKIKNISNEEVECGGNT